MWDRLRLTVLHAQYRAELEGSLPEFKGSTFRGALGHALKDVACLERGGRAACEHCTRPDRCAAGALFDSTSGSGFPSIHDRPAPFVVTPSGPGVRNDHFRVGDRLGFTLTLVGRGRVWHPWVIAALADMGWRGLGIERRPWSLAELHVEGPVGCRQRVDVASQGLGTPIPELTAADLVAALPFPDSARATLRFLTPAHLVRDKQLVRRLDGPTLFSRLLRRLGALLEAFEDWSPASYSFAPVLEEAAALRCTEQRLRINSLERYSERQGRKHPLTGLVGELVLADIPASLWPFLVVGQWIHVGKGSTFGMGKYILEPHSRP